MKNQSFRTNFCLLRLGLQLKGPIHHSRGLYGAPEVFGGVFVAHISFYRAIFLLNRETVNDIVFRNSPYYFHSSLRLSAGGRYCTFTFFSMRRECLKLYCESLYIQWNKVTPVISCFRFRLLFLKKTYTI